MIDLAWTVDPATLAPGPRAVASVVTYRSLASCQFSSRLPFTFRHFDRRPAIVCCCCRTPARANETCVSRAAWSSGSRSGEVGRRVCIGHWARVGAVVTPQASLSCILPVLGVWGQLFLISFGIKLYSKECPFSGTSVFSCAAVKMFTCWCVWLDLLLLSWNQQRCGGV